MPEFVHRKLSVLAACDGAQESRYRADAVGGWIEGGGRVSAHSSLLQGSEELLQTLEIL